MEALELAGRRRSCGVRAGVCIEVYLRSHRDSHCIAGISAAWVVVAGSFQASGRLAMWSDCRPAEPSRWSPWAALPQSGRWSGFPQKCWRALPLSSCLCVSWEAYALDGRGTLRDQEQSGFSADGFGSHTLLWWGGYENYPRMLAANDAKRTEKAKGASKVFNLQCVPAVDQVRGNKAEHTLPPDIPSDAWFGWLRTRLEAEFQPASASLWPSEWAINLQPPPEGGGLTAYWILSLSLKDNLRADANQG
jgi:hypothetical protein